MVRDCVMLSSYINLLCFPSFALAFSTGCIVYLHFSVTFSIHCWENLISLGRVVCACLRGDNIADHEKKKSPSKGKAAP